jgi:hypothetical protein
MYDGFLRLRLGKIKFDVINKPEDFGSKLRSNIIVISHSNLESIIFREDFQDVALGL